MTVHRPEIDQGIVFVKAVRISQDDSVFKWKLSVNIQPVNSLETFGLQSILRCAYIYIVYYFGLFLLWQVGHHDQIVQLPATIKTSLSHLQYRFLPSGSLLTLTEIHRGQGVAISLPDWNHQLQRGDPLECLYMQRSQRTCECSILRQSLDY